MTPMIVAIWIAGGIQLALALANLEVARKLDYRANLAKLTPMVGQIFRAHAVYIVLIILWFGALCLFFAARLASRDPLARFLTGGLAVFWGLRAIIQLTVYDKKVRKDYRLQDVAFLAACTLLTGVFLAAAVH
jgi:hypothetical protein